MPSPKSTPALEGSGGERDDTSRRSLTQAEVQTSAKFADARQARSGLLSIYRSWSARGFSTAFGWGDQFNAKTSSAASCQYQEPTRFRFRFRHSGKHRHHHLRPTLSDEGNRAVEIEQNMTDIGTGSETRAELNPATER